MRRYGRWILSSSNELGLAKPRNKAFHPSPSPSHRSKHFFQPTSSKKGTSLLFRGPLCARWTITGRYQISHKTLMKHVLLQSPKQWIDIIGDSTSKQVSCPLSQMVSSALTSFCKNADGPSDNAIWLGWERGGRACFPKNNSQLASRPSHPHAYHYPLAAPILELEYPGEGTPESSISPSCSRIGRSCEILAYCQR